MSKRAVFLDRDGILNRVIHRGDKVTAPWCLAEFELLAGAKALVDTVNSLGYLAIVATNQPDIAHGRLSPVDLAAMHEVLKKMLGIEHIESCTSSDNADRRRKPNPGMLLDAAEKHGISLEHSFFVGDTLKDIEAGKKASTKTILLETNYNQSIHGAADFNFRSLEAIAVYLRGLHS